MACPAAWPPASAAATETPNAPTIARHATPPDTDFGSRRPRPALIRKPRNGSSGISSSIQQQPSGSGIRNSEPGGSRIPRSAYRSPSPFQQRERVRTQRLAMAEERDHQRKADRSLGRRDRHHEERDDLAVHRPEIPA